MSTYSPKRSQILVTLALTTIGVLLTFAWQPASGEWDRRERMGTFQLRSEIPLGEIRGQELLAQMARLYTELETVTGLRGPALPVQVNLFKTRESYLAFLEPSIPIAAERSALFVSSPDGGQIYVCYQPEYEQDVRHECTHAVLHQMVPSIPIWLDEGLAEYFEMEAEQRENANPYLPELKELASREWAPDLARLEQLDNVEQLSAEDYRECWGWAHFLIHGPAAGQEEFKEYLQLLSTGEPAGQLSHRLRTCMPDMDVQLINHLRDW